MGFKGGDWEIYARKLEIRNKMLRGKMSMICSYQRMLWTPYSQK